MSSKSLLAEMVAILSLICAGSPAWAQPAPPTDACSLLTPAQVSAALGVSVGAGQRLVPTSPLLCTWEQTGASGPNSKKVMASIIRIDQFAHEKTPLQGITETQASGIGDEAHYMTTPGFGTGLSVKKGNYAFKIRVNGGFSLDQTEAIEKKLAQDALAKL